MKRNEQIKNIPLTELRPFKDHPFKVADNEDMERIIDSIRELGTLTPAIVRPLPDGGYEMISGHRRMEACRRLGITEMPVVIREMNDDEAVIAMVDANLQRDRILPSEKAFAYKMKLEAMNRQGKRTDLTLSQVGKKLNSYEEAAKASGDSRNQIHRYIRLTHLIPELLDKVDNGEMALSPAVELSYLPQEEQRVLLDAMAMCDCSPSHAQAIRIRRIWHDCRLDKEAIYSIMSEAKPNQLEHIRLRREEFRQYFPTGYTDEQMKNDIIKGLELLKRQRTRKNGAR